MSGLFLERRSTGIRKSSDLGTDDHPCGFMVYDRDLRNGRGLHFSGRAFRRPGWVSVSTHDGDRGFYTWMDDQVLLIELRQDGRVVRLAHTHALVDPDLEHDYWPSYSPV